MMRSFGKIPALACAFLACAIMAVTSGCASGGYKLTRQYAGWLNRQQIVLRIVLYILTGIVFAVTMLIDVVVFNTMDFWEGRVSANDYEFREDGKIFFVKHEYQPGGSLRRSTIKITDEASKSPLQEIVLNETSDGQIEMFVDGQLRTRVANISSLPVASIFDRTGNLIRQENILLTPTVATAR